MLTPKMNPSISHSRVLAELQKLDGLPVIRGDQEEEQVSHNSNISFYLLPNPLALQVLHASFCQG